MPDQITPSKESLAKNTYTPDVPFSEIGQFSQPGLTQSWNLDDQLSAFKGDYGTQIARGQTITDLINDVENIQGYLQSSIANYPKAQYETLDGIKFNSSDAFSKLSGDLNPLAPTLRAFNRPMPLGSESDYNRYSQSPDFQSFGYTPGLGTEQEYKYGRAMSWGDTIGNALAGGSQIAIGTFVEGWKGWARMTDALFSWDSSKLMGSPEERYQIAKEQEDIFNKYAIYDTETSQDSIFNRQFFGTMLQQAGFTVGAVAQFALEAYVTAGIGSAIAKGLQGTALARTFVATTTAAELANDVRKASKVVLASERITNSIAKGAKALVPFYGTVDDMVKLNRAGAGFLQLSMTGLGGIKRALSEFNMARSESIFESASTYKGLKDRLTQQYLEEKGVLPTGDDLEKINQTAEDASHDNFWTNIGILSVMNRLQFNTMFKSFNTTRRFFNDSAGELAQDAFTVTGRIAGKEAKRAYQKSWFFGQLGAVRGIAADFGGKKAAWEATKMLGKGFTRIEGSEGVQELLQEASNKGLSDYYYDLYHGKKGYSGKMQRVIDSIQNPITDMQGMKTFLMGALTGALISPGRKVITKVNESLSEKARKKQDPEYQSRKQRVAENVALVNSLYKDPTQFKSEWIANVKVQNKAAETMEEAARNQNRYVFYNAKDSAFAKAVSAAIKLDMFDSVRDTVKELGSEMTNEEFQQAFGMDPSAKNKGDVKMFMDNIANQMEEYYTLYYNLKDKYGDRIMPELYKGNKPEEYFQAKVAKKALDEAIEILATNVYKSKQAVKRASELQQEMTKNPNIGASSAEVITKMGSEEAIVEHIRLLKREIAGLEAAEDLTPEQKELLKDKKQELNAAERWQSSHAEIVNNSDEEYSPTAETRAYDSFAELINLFNKRAKKTTEVSKEDVDDNFIRIIDYIRLNKDSKAYVDALNLLADPTNMQLITSSMVSAFKLVNELFKKEHIDEVKKNADVEEETDKEGTGKSVKIATKDKTGKDVEVTVTEGESYLTESNPTTRIYKGKTPVKYYDQDVIKIARIDDAGNITFTYDNSGESVTMAPEEFAELGKLTPLKGMNPIMQIYFKNRDVVFKINVFKKTGKPHYIRGKYADKDFSDAGVLTDARLEMIKKGDTYYLKIAYRNPVTKLVEYFDYDSNYLAKYGSDKRNILDITQSEEEFLLEQAQKQRVEQIELLTQAIDDLLSNREKLLEQKRKDEESYQKIKKDIEDYIAEIELIDERFNNIKPYVRGRKSNERKELEARREVLRQLVKDAEALVEDYNKRQQDLQDQLTKLDELSEYYKEGIAELTVSTQPFVAKEEDITADVQKDIAQTSQEQLIRPSRNITNQDINDMIADTEAEFDLIRERIRILQDIINNANNVLARLGRVDELLETLEGITDKQQLINKLVLMKNQESDAANKKTIQNLINSFNKGRDSLELLYIYENVDRLSEAKEELKKLLDEANVLQDKLDRLNFAKAQRDKLSLLERRLNMLKAVQDAIIKYYNIKREKAGIKQEGTKVVVSSGVAPTDALIKGPNTLFTPVTLVDIFPESDEEKESFTTVVDGFKPALSETAMFKSAGRQFSDLNDTTFTSPQSARYFKFTETAMLRDEGGSVFYFMPITKDSKEFQFLRETGEFEDDIRLVVVRRDADGKFKPVGVDGKILETPTKDNMIYTGMHGNADLYSANPDVVYEWMSKNFAIFDKKTNKFRYTKEETVQIAKNFIVVRDAVKDRVKNGDQVFLPIIDKSPGVYNREPKTQGFDSKGDPLPQQPQQLPLNGRLIEDNPAFKNLKHPDGKPIRLDVSTTGDGRIKSGRAMMVREGEPPIIVYNRRFTEAEHNNIIDVLKRLAQLKAKPELTEEETVEMNSGTRYLQGLVHWAPRKAAFEPLAFQMWVSETESKVFLNVGKIGIEFTPQALEENKDKIIKAIEYHKINKAMLSETSMAEPFTEVKVVNDRIIQGKEYVNYQHYLLADRDGGPVVYTNIKPYEAPKAEGLTPQDYQLKQVYFIYDVTSVVPDVPVEKNNQPDKSGITQYSITQKEINTKGISLYDLQINIPKEGKVTFVTSRKNGDELYLHTEYKNGSYEIFQVIDEKGNDLTNEMVNEKSAKQIYQNYLNDDLLKLDKVKEIAGEEGKNLQYEVLKSFKDVYTRIEEYARQGEVTNEVKSVQSVAQQGVVQPTPSSSTSASEVISDEVFNNFVDKNIVSNDILDSIAQKIIDRAPLSPRETAIFTGKTADINEIIRKRTPVSETKPAVVASGKGFEDYVETMYKRHVADSRNNGSAPLSKQDFRTRFAKQLEVGYKAIQDATVDNIVNLGKGAVNDNYDPNARVQDAVTAVTPENVEKFKAWMKETLPQFPIEIFDELIDGKYGGQFFNGIVRLYQNAEQGTGFHEAFEAVFNSLLSPEKQQALIKEFKQRPDYQSLPSYQWALARYKNVSEDTLIKEAIAEEFREYMLSEAENVVKDSPKRNTFFRRVWNMIKKLLNRFFNLSLDVQEQVHDEIRSVFSDIAKGKYKNVEPVAAFDPSIKHNRASVAGTSVEFTRLLMEGMTTVFFAKLNQSKDYSIESLFDKTNNAFEDLYKETFTTVYNRFYPGLSKIINSDEYQFAAPEKQKEIEKKYFESLKLQDEKVIGDLFSQKNSAISRYNTDVREQFKNYLSQFGLKFKTLEDENVAKTEEDISEIESKEESSNTLGIRDVLYIDPTTLTYPEVKLLLLSLPMNSQDETGRFEATFNKINLPALTPYKKTLNILLNELSNVVPMMRKQEDGSFKKTSAIEEMFNNLDKRFKDPVFKARYKPGYEWIQSLKNRLKYDLLKTNAQQLTESQMNLIIAFESSFTRNRNNPLKLLVGANNKLRDVNAISVTTIEKIKDEWRNNIKDTAARVDVTKLESGGLLYINPAGRIEINLNSYKMKYLLSAKDIRGYIERFNSLGLRLSITPEKVTTKDAKEIEIAYKGLRSVFEFRIKESAPLNYDELFNNQVVAGPVNTLLGLELKYRSEDMLLSHQTAENKTQYAITLPSEISYVVNSLNAADSLEEFVMSNPQYGEVIDGTVYLHSYNAGSYVLKPGGVLFDENGRKIPGAEIKYEYIQGMSTDMDVVGDNTDRLTPNDKIVQEMHHILRGSYFTIINSDKASEFAVKLGHFVKIRDISNLDLIENRYIDALRDEVMHALRFHFFPNNIKNHQENILMLGHFAGILNFREKGKESDIQRYFNGLVKGLSITKSMSEEDIMKAFTTIADNFTSVVKNQGIIKDYINVKTDETKDWLLSTKIFDQTETDQGTTRYSTKAIDADAKVLKDAQINVKEELGDAQFTRLARFLTVNRQLAVYEQHKLFYGHPALYKELAKRANGANSQKNVVVENPSVLAWMNTNKKRYDGRTRDVENPIVRNLTYADFTVFSEHVKFIAESIYAPLSKSVGKKTAEQMIGATFNEDGSLKKIVGGKKTYIEAYTNLTESDGQSMIMPDYFRDMMYLSHMLSAEQEALLNWENASEIMDRSKKSHPYYKKYSEADIAKAKEILARPKPKAVIQVLKPQGFGFQKTDGMTHVNFLKNSVYTLTWSRVKNNPVMLAKYIDAQNRQADIIGFESGHKVGAMRNAKNKAASFYSENGESSNEIPVEQDIYAKYIGIQVVMPDYAKDKVIFGSQIRKIILSNLPKELEPYREEYIKALDDLLAIEMEDLISELGLKLENGKYVVEDLSKMVNLLRNEAIKRDVPSNVIDMIDIIPTEQGEELLHPFDSNPARERIEYILNAIVDRRIVRSEMFGKGATQVASTLFMGKRDFVYLDENGVYQKTSDYNSLTDKQKKTAKLTSSSLNFYNEAKPYIEVYIPWYFKDITPQKAGFIEKDGIWVPGPDSKIDPKILEAIGFRIPTSALSSAESIVIKGFLDPSYGDMIVVPSEIVGKAGSDFDIDKLNIFLPNYSVDSKGIKYISETENTKQGLQNKIIQVMKNIIQHPENRRQLLTPNGSATLKKISEKIITLRGEKQREGDMTKLSEWKYMMETRETFVSSKQLVGIGALQITSHAMSQVGEVELTGTYTDFTGEKSTNIKLPNSKTNRIDLTVDEEGMFLFDIFNEALTGSVDASKDPFIFDIRLNLATAATWFYLTKRGVTQENIALFFSQPIIDDYFNNKNANDTFVNEINDNKDKFSQVVVDTVKEYYTLATGRLIPEDEKPYITMKKFVAIQEKYSSYTPEMLEKAISAKEMTPQLAEMQIALLMDMLDYRNQANKLSNFIRAISYDTSRTKNLIEYHLQKSRYNRAVEDKFITKESLDRVFDKTFLARIKDAKDDVLKMFEKFFVMASPEAMQLMEPVLKILDDDSIFLTQMQKEDLLNRYQNFVLTYILQNTSFGNNERLSSYWNLFTDGKQISMAKRLKQLKDKYPNNAALSNLFPIINQNRNSTDNIKLFNNKVPTYDINQISESIETLYTQAEMMGDMELKEFVENLTRFTILQSGLQVSPITFTKVMPASLYASITSEIFKNYRKYNEQPNVEEIWRAFHQNNWKNRTIVPTYKASRKKKNRMRASRDGLITFGQSESVTSRDYIKIYDLKEGMKYDSPARFEEKFDITLYEKVRVKDATGEDLTDMLTQVKYRPINRLGNGMYALETTPNPATNGSRFPDVNPFVNEQVIAKAVQNWIDQINAQAFDTPTEQTDVRTTISMQSFNVEKIKAGAKTTTTRSQREFEKIGIPIGKSAIVIFGGQDFRVTNRGLLSINEAGGKEAMLKSEGYATVDDLLYEQTKDWIAGKGKLYVYDITSVQTATFDTLTEFPEERKQEILTNFATKHKMTEEQAKTYINEALQKDRQNVIDKLKECY